MLYSNYEKKIENIQKILKKIYKFRILIIIVIGLVLAASVFLMSIKGTFSQKLALSSSKIYYGQDYNCKAKAYLSSVEYEFYDKNTATWQKEKPYKAGEYKVRAKTKKAFGATGYSNEIAFNILPYEASVTINEGTLVYGQKPTPSVTLIGNDKIVDYTYNFSDISVGERAVKIESVSIVNSNGEEVNFCYNFGYETKSVLITQKQLNITFVGAEKVYDGTPLSNEEYVIDGLEYEDEIKVLRYPQLTSAGEMPNNASYNILNKNGKNVKDNYKITVDAQNLIVTKRQISIKPKDEQKVYDATPLTPKDFEIVSGEFVAGHYIDSVTFLGSTTDCGKYVSSLQDAVVLNSKKVSVISNYEIIYLDGTLEVTPCRVEVTPYATKIYNASSEYINANIEVDITRYDGSKGLFMWHELDYTLADNPTAINVGTHGLNFVDTPRITYFGNDISYNYEIVCGNGILEIKPCYVEIKANAKKVYDATNSFDDVEVEFDITMYDGSKGLFEGHEPVCQFMQNSRAVNVGKYALRVKKPLVIKCGDEDVSHNYDIKLIDGELEIMPRPISIVVDSDSKEYDRNPLYCDTYTIVYGSLVDTHTIKVVSETPSITQVGEIFNDFEIDIVDKNGESVYYNYDVYKTPGILTITKRYMKIELYDVQKIYDGTPAQIDTRYWYLENKLLPGDSIRNIFYYVVENSYGEIIPTKEVISAGEYQVRAQCIIRYSGSYKDYYDIEIVGSIIIDKAEITITSDSASKPYNGNKLIADGYEITYGKVAECDYLEVNVTGEQTAVGKSPNTISYIIINSLVLYIDGDGVYETENYKITIKQGTLRVTEN